MGAVYEVHDQKRDAPGALKILHARILKRDERARDRFVREAKATGRVESDHVVKVFDHDPNPGGAPWMLMELLHGETLFARVQREGPLSLVDARRLVLELGHGLGAAHAKGVIHMDLKPENVFLAKSARVDGREIVKILDFGLARFIEPDRSKALNTQGMGTLAWSAPEQYEDDAVPKAVDVWPLGLLAFWMLTGRQYWSAQNSTKLANRETALMREIHVDPIAPASERAQKLGVADRLPDGFDAWFARCVTRDVLSRYRDAADATEALQVLLQDADRARSAAPPVPSPKVDPTPQPPPSPARPLPSPPPLPAPRMPTQQGKPAVPHGLTAPMPPRPTPATVPVSPPTHAPPPLPSNTTSPMTRAASPGIPAKSRWPYLAAVVGALGLVGLASLLRPAPAPVVPGPAPAPTLSCSPGMKLIPAGRFAPGSRASAAVTVPAFCIDETEVTWSAYQRCVTAGGARGCAPANEAWWPDASDAQRARHVQLCTQAQDPERPVACVSWDMARAFCQQRGSRVDLPTSTQWEYAARGTDGRIYPWGVEPPAATRLNACGAECFAFWNPGRVAPPGEVLYAADDGATAAVDVRRFALDRSAFGVLGMGGNVQEWTLSCATDDLATEPRAVRCVTDAQAPRVGRGGAWSSVERDAVKATASVLLSAATQAADLGFRCVAPPR